MQHYTPSACCETSFVLRSASAATALLFAEAAASALAALSWAESGKFLSFAAVPLDGSLLRVCVLG